LNIDRRDLKIMMAHFRQQKWFQEEVAEWEKARDLRNRRALEVAKRAETLGLMPPGLKQERLREIREAVEKEVV